MAVTIRPCSLAAAHNSRPRATCLDGHCGLPALMAAKMCFGTAPIGVVPSQHWARHAGVLNRGAFDMHNMQNSTPPAITQT